MVFTSRYGDIEYPKDLTVWQWAFEDARYSPLYKNPPNEVGGFVNAVTRERLSFAQVKEHATHLSTALAKRYGLQESDTVSLFSPNTIWYPVAMFAVLRLGGRVNGASPAYSLDEMTHALKTAETKFIMTIPGSIKVAIAAAEKCGISKDRILLLDGELEGFVSVKQLMHWGRQLGSEGQVPCFKIPAGKTNDICGYLNFSSGTTGFPKAVMLSHQNVIAQCTQLLDVAGPGKKRYLASLPLFHISGLVRFLHWPLASNEECIMLPHFTMENFLQAIVDFKITDLTLVPSIVIRLVNDPIVDKYDLSSVKVIACGAAPVGAAVLSRLQKKFPWTGFRQSYGMTETCCCLSTHPPEFYSYEYADTAGMLLGSVVVKIVDIDTGKELGPNGVGEIYAKGPQNAMGYLANPTETAETFGADGYLRTGDVGCIDSQGFIRIVDRIKEMIKVKGQQIAPADLESLLLTHPDVNDCAVLGIPDDYSAERPKAFIVLKDTAKPSEEMGHSLMQFVKEKRVRYKWVKEVEFVKEIPKSPSSKILRRLLRNRSQNSERGLVVKDVVVRPKL